MKFSTCTTTSSVRCLTVFHDLLACALDEHNPNSNVQSLFHAIDECGADLTKPAAMLALDWRCVAPLQHQITAELAEHLVDVGISSIQAGRKPEAVSKKIRDDVRFFIESHSNVREHAVVLAVANTAQYTGELELLHRAGIRTFVATANGVAPVVQSPVCVFLGSWASTVAPAAGAKMPAAAVLDDPAVVAALVGHVVSGGASGDGGGGGGASATWGSTSTWGVPSLSNIDRWAPKRKHKVWQPALLLPSAAAADADADEDARPNPVTTTPTRSLAIAESKGDSPDRGQRNWRRAPVQPHRKPFVHRTPATVNGSFGRVARGPTRSHAPVKKTSGSATAPFDPYHIIFGSLHRLAEGEFCIVEKPQQQHPAAGPARHMFVAEDLDFDYCWINQLPVRPAGDVDLVGAGTDICCRLHKSGRVTDIRMCGEVVRIIRGEFGFISNELFPDNLYFRVADVDPAASGAHASSAINQGDVVAFRVGRKGERKWAMRVWKTPAHTQTDPHHMQLPAPPQPFMLPAMARSHSDDSFHYPRSPAHVPMPMPARSHSVGARHFSSMRHDASTWVPSS